MKKKIKSLAYAIICPDIISSGNTLKFLDHKHDNFHHYDNCLKMCSVSANETNTNKSMKWVLGMQFTRENRVY